MVVNEVNLLAYPFKKRLQEADSAIKTRFTIARRINRESPSTAPIDIYMKEMFSIWHAKYVFSHLLDVHKLEHENDGLIFTVNLCPYYPGTCP